LFKINLRVFIIIIFLLIVFVLFNQFASIGVTEILPLKVISAYGTSSSKDSKPVTDLLDLKKEGSWKPNSKDAGVNEGLFFQFACPVLIDYIEVKLRAKAPSRSILTYYLDGKRNSSLNKK